MPEDSPHPFPFDLSSISGSSKLDLTKYAAILPLIVGFLPTRVVVGGKLIDLRATMGRAVADGDLDMEDALMFLAVYASAPSKGKPALPPTVVVVPAAPTHTGPGLPPPPAVDDEDGGPGTPPAQFQGEVWVEEGWHDWCKTPENEDGHFDAGAEVNAGKVLPPAPVLRLMAGIRNPTGGPAAVPNGNPQIAFPVITHHFTYSSGEVYSFDSDAEPGSHQPVPDLGHVQGGSIYQNSSGWDFIIRLKGFSGKARTLRYWITQKGSEVASNTVDIKISRNKS